MKKSYLQLLSGVNVGVMVFCLLTIPGEVEDIWGTTAKYVAWAVIFGIGLIVALILTHYIRKEG